MKNLLKIILLLFLIVGITEAAQKATFDDMLSLLKEKEKIEEQNSRLLEKINKLENKLKLNEKKYDELLKEYNNMKEIKKKKDIKDNELIVNEIKGRLPVPYIILDYDDEKVAKVLKLKWYYVFKEDGTTMFNGKYLENKMKIGDKYLTYIIKDIKDDHIKYCLIKDPKKCINKYLIDNNIVNSMKKIEIVDGIPDNFLTNKDNFQELLSKILSATNPLTKKGKDLKDNNENEENLNLDDIINPKVKGKSSGVSIPKNNVPDLSNINDEKMIKGNK